MNSCDITVAGGSIRIHQAIGTSHEPSIVNGPLEPPQGENRENILYLLVHGAGHSGLVWTSTMAQLMKKSCAILAYDVRGHGNTRLENESDLSLATLSNDLKVVLDTVYPLPDRPRDLILVGHSLGGAVVVDAVFSGLKCLGIVVLDVVEGTALESLTHMHRILASRPSAFNSMDQAIDWAVTFNGVKRASAQVSIPDQLTLLEANQKYVWRTDLAASEPYWKDWYLGMSDKFLSVKCARLLILAGTDRLDKPLTIGQMQGKFQMLVFPTGHNIHEDAPEKLAAALDEFQTRNQPLKIIKRFPIPSPSKEPKT